MKTYKQILIFIFSSLLISACGGGVGDTDTGGGDALKILSVDPSENSTPSTVCAITATFNQLIDVATVDDQSFEVTPSDTGTALTAAEGSWGLDPSSSAQIKFVPVSALPVDPETITVTINTSVTDTDGNNLPASKTWTFTATLPCSPTP